MVRRTLTVCTRGWNNLRDIVHLTFLQLTFTMTSSIASFFVFNDTLLVITGCVAFVPSKLLSSIFAAVLIGESESSSARLLAFCQQRFQEFVIFAVVVFAIQFVYHVRHDGHMRHYGLIMGPIGCEKTAIAQYLARERIRGFQNLHTTMWQCTLSPHTPDTPMHLRGFDIGGAISSRLWEDYVDVRNVFPSSTSSSYSYSYSRKYSYHHRLAANPIIFFVVDSSSDSKRDEEAQRALQFLLDTIDSLPPPPVMEGGNKWLVLILGTDVGMESLTTAEDNRNSLFRLSADLSWEGQKDDPSGSSSRRTAPQNAIVSPVFLCSPLASVASSGKREEGLKGLNPDALAWLRYRLPAANRIPSWRERIFARASRLLLGKAKSYLDPCKHAKCPSGKGFDGYIACTVPAYDLPDKEE